MKVEIIIKDYAEAANNKAEINEIEVKCIGDTTITGKATPAQILANKCMEFIAKELES